VTGLTAADVVEISTAETYPLRLAVLRFDTPTKEVAFKEDDWPGSWHLGIRVDSELVCTSTWVPRELEGAATDRQPGIQLRGIQLRGMATARHLQRTGAGGVVLERGCELAAERGFTLVWARARDAALAFYERHGFLAEGEGFVDEATQLPHHLVIRHLP
jgi:GNAT superfamily N-acetyltransferase